MKAAALGAGIVGVASWALTRNAQLPQGPSRLHWGPLVIGHRGCRFIAGIPENTLAAFEYARSNGAQGIEVDIRLTRDDQLVVFHDAFLGANMSGVKDPKTRIDGMDLVDLKGLTYAEDKTGQVRIPTLEETLLYCRDNQLKLLIEVKEMARPGLCIEKLLGFYDQYPDFMYPETTVVAFSPFVLYAIRKRNRKIAVGQLYSGVVLQTLATHRMDYCPALVAMFPRTLDAILGFVQTKISPWVSGVSTMGIRYDLISEKSKRMWFKRRISIYLWGFTDVEQCTSMMHTNGVILGVDDSFAQYAPPRQEPTYDSVFPDAPSVTQNLLESPEDQ